MKKVIALVVLFVVAAIGMAAYQFSENETQKELYEEAAVFFQEKDYKKAIQYFEEAKEHNNLFSGSRKTDLKYYQAEALMKLEEYEEAIGLYDELIQEFPKDNIAYMMKAYCLFSSGCMEDGAGVYEQGYKNTKDDEFLYYLANQYVTMEAYDKALEVIHGAGNMDEDTGRKLDFLEIVIYEKQQDYAAAYEKAVEYCQAYPEDEKGLKERDFLETR